MIHEIPHTLGQSKMSVIHLETVISARRQESSILARSVDAHQDTQRRPMSGRLRELRQGCSAPKKK